MLIMKTLAPILVLFSMVAVSEAKDWRGIVPLRSTRADVERALGKPNAPYGRYKIENEEADITYSGERCANGWNVPRDTVIRILVSLSGKRRLSEFNLDLNKFKKWSDTHLIGDTYYTNRAQGITYRVLENGTVLSIYYEPTNNDDSLRCASSTTQPAESTGNPHCPLITVSCSNAVNQEYSCVVNYSGGQPQREQRYEWSVSIGEIISGQGTHSVKVRTSCGSNPARLTVQIGKGIHKECPTRASYLFECEKR
ncbi:MAG TPA: hypothetical protein VFD48_01555 [Pyrinomonadaceae bacterium]|nr:hypothetical protein [Pyrinomonadaceae bacterium]